MKESKIKFAIFPPKCDSIIKRKIRFDYKQVEMDSRTTSYSKLPPTLSVQHHSIFHIGEKLITL